MIRRAALLAMFAVAPLAARGQPDDEPDFARDVKPLLEESCIVCHGGTSPEAALSFERFATEADARADIAVWLKAQEKLAHGEMPPPEAPAPDPKLLDRAHRWLDTRLGTGHGAWPLDPGRVTLRRLSRFEYAATLRDLLGVDAEIAARLPADDVGYGFDNMGDVLAVPPLLLEKYAAVAEAIALSALPGPELRQTTTRHFEAESLPCTLEDAQHTDSVVLFSPGSVRAELELPRAGDYVVRVGASGDQAGPDPCFAELRAGKRLLTTFAVTAQRPAAQTVEWRGAIGGGKQPLTLAFTNDYYQPATADHAILDRNLVLDWIEVEGPVDSFPPTRGERRIYVCGVDHDHTRNCAPAIVKALASRAWRRPASEPEVARLLRFVDDAAARGEPLVLGLREVLAATLVSPNFLFRVELDPSPDDPAAAHPLTDHELAARLSYFLWSSLPDDPLAAAADQQRLRQPGALAEQARRMLKDPRASALVTNFAAQWLQQKSLDSAAPDPALFPEFDDELRRAMRLESELFVEAILREQRPLRELIDADFTFVNEPLAKLYGIAGVKGPEMRRVRLEDPVRGGVLTQASLLTVTSNPTRTSPVKRGKFLLERILGAPPPPPPPGVGVLDESDAARHAASLRERLEAHRAKPECAVCHARMDALGFALERFSPIGGWREQADGRPIDDRGTLADGRTIDGPAGLKHLLLDGDDFTRTVAEKLLTYALGRGPTADDRRQIAAVVAAFDGRSPTFEELITRLVELDPFRRRRGEALPKPPSDR